MVDGGLHCEEPAMGESTPWDGGVAQVTATDCVILWSRRCCIIPWSNCRRCYWPHLFARMSATHAKACVRSTLVTYDMGETDATNIGVQYTLIEMLQSMNDRHELASHVGGVSTITFHIITIITSIIIFITIIFLII